MHTQAFMLRVAHALWIIHTHLMDRWDSTPRLAFLSPEPASGKSRALEVTELLVPNPVSAVNVSPAYLFRKVGCEEGVTILFDEIDTVFGPKAKENEEIRGLLNAGHRRGAVAGRCVVHGKTVMTEEIPAYAPVALAGLGWLPDTIMSRSVIIRMRRRHQGENVEQFRRRIHLIDGNRVRASIEIWTKEFPREVAWPPLPPEIQDRDADVWEPLIAIADAVGGDWPVRARSAAVALVSESKESEPSLGIRLLSDVRTIFGEFKEMATRAILAALHELAEAPWGDIRGKPLDERGLAGRLRQYGVKSKNIAVGSTRPKGYVRADLHDAWVRYLPSPQSPATSATYATSATEPEIQAASVGAVADVADVLPFPLPKKASHIGEVAAVAEVADLSGHSGEGCAHCHRVGTDADPLVEVFDGQTDAMMHRGCLREWLSHKQADDGLNIPDFLRRPV